MPLHAKSDRHCFVSKTFEFLHQSSSSSVKGKTRVDHLGKVLFQSNLKWFLRKLKLLGSVHKRCLDKSWFHSNVSPFSSFICLTVITSKSVNFSLELFNAQSNNIDQILKADLKNSKPMVSAGNHPNSCCLLIRLS